MKHGTSAYIFNLRRMLLVTVMVCAMVRMMVVIRLRRLLRKSHRTLLQAYRSIRTLTKCPSGCNVQFTRLPNTDVVKYTYTDTGNTYHAVLEEGGTLTVPYPEPIPYITVSCATICHPEDRQRFNEYLSSAIGPAKVSLSQKVVPALMQTNGYPEDGEYQVCHVILEDNRTNKYLSFCGSLAQVLKNIDKTLETKSA